MPFFYSILEKKKYKYKTRDWKFMGKGQRTASCWTQRMIPQFCACYRSWLSGKEQLFLQILSTPLMVLTWWWLLLPAKRQGWTLQVCAGLVVLSLPLDSGNFSREILLFHSDVHLQGSMIHTGHMHAMLMKWTGYSEKSLLNSMRRQYWRM